MFERLATESGEWPRRLLELADFGASDAAIPGDLDLSFIKGWWGESERGLDPPASLLSWLVRNPGTWYAEPDTEERRRLFAGDSATLELALEGLRSPHAHRAWFILEGRTFPDAFLETRDALVVVEGKRTEHGPTTHTKWMAGRHQIWRHIDAAWEIRDQKNVFGLFIVEGEESAVPPKWQQATLEVTEEAALSGSFPHRTSDEVDELRKCFLGVTTWEGVCEAFGIEMSDLPATVGDRAPR